jgi:hypothetical protein
MAAHYPTLREKVFARYPYLHSSAFERRMLFGRGSEGSSVPQNERELPCERASVGA